MVQYNPSTVLGLKIVRRFFRRSIATFQHGSLVDAPILFANSFPKSGTHLLTQVLQGFSRLGPAVNSGLPAVVTFDGPTGRLRQGNMILKDLGRLKGGDIAYGHLHAFPEVAAEMTRDKMAPFFVFRDPRDVVVSHVHYVTEIEVNHVHHQYYSQELSTFDERVDVSISGRAGLVNPFPNIHERFKPYLDWLGLPEVLPIRFEDLITHRSETLEKIINHAVGRGFTLKVPFDYSINILESAIQPEKSPTFRSGTIGKWRDSFSSSHKILFKENAGDLLIQLGYEKNNDW